MTSLSPRLRGRSTTTTPEPAPAHGTRRSSEQESARVASNQIDKPPRTRNRLALPTLCQHASSSTAPANTRRLGQAASPGAVESTEPVIHLAMTSGRDRRPGPTRLRRTISDWWTVERALRDCGRRPWRRTIVSLAMALLWEHGGWILRPLGRWRCEICGQPLESALSQHACPDD